MSSRILTLLVFAISSVSVAAEPMKCHVGPITIELGGGTWQVTSCDDGRSLVLATMKGNPSMPFVFIVKRNDQGSKIAGEGNGSKEHSATAFGELKALSEAQLDDLVQATKRIGSTP